MKKEDEQFLARQQEISARNKELSYIQGKIEMQRSRILGKHMFEKSSAPGLTYAIPMCIYCRKPEYTAV